MDVGSSLRFQNGCDVAEERVYTGASFCCESLRQKIRPSDDDACHPFATFQRLLRSSVVQACGVFGGGCVWILNGHLLLAAGRRGLRGGLCVGLAAVGASWVGDSGSS